MEKQVYNATEVAQIIGCSRNLTYQLIAQKRLPAIRISDRRIVVPKAALERFLGEASQPKGGE